MFKIIDKISGRKTALISGGISSFGRDGNIIDIYNTFLKLSEREDITRAQLTLVVRNWENSTIIEDALIEKIQGG